MVSADSSIRRMTAGSVGPIRVPMQISPASLTKDSGMSAQLAGSDSFPNAQALAVLGSIFLRDRISERAFANSSIKTASALAPRPLLHALQLFLPLQQSVQASSNGSTSGSELDLPGSTG